MPTIKKLISSWRKWINRNQTFQKKELDELEDHLIEEIDYLVQRENLTEEEAFHKATMDIGKREVLDNDFRKVQKFSGKRIKDWFQLRIIPILLISTFLTAFLFFDSMFASNHIQIDTIRSWYTKVNLYKVGTNRDGSQLNPSRDFPWQKKGEEVWGRENYWMPDSFHSLDVYGFLIPEKNKTFPVKPKFYSQWDLPLLADDTSSTPLSFFIVIDSIGQIWFDTDGHFNDSRLKDLYLTLFGLKAVVSDLKYDLITVLDFDKKPFLLNPFKKFDPMSLLNKLKIYSLENLEKERNKFKMSTDFEFSKLDPISSNNTIGPFLCNGFFQLDTEVFVDTKYLLQLIHRNNKNYLLIQQYQQKPRAIHFIPFLYNKIKNSFTHQ